MIEYSNILRLWILIFASFLFIISILTYYRIRRKRLLFTSIAFTVFLIKGILLNLGLINGSIHNLITTGLENILDLAILSFFLIAILKK